jgi:putative flippase GtrA
MADARVAGASGARFARFCLVGAAGASAYFVVLAGLIELARVPVVAASTFAFGLVVVQNYLLHAGWTFAAGPANPRAFGRFVAVSAAGLALNAAVMHAGVHWLGIAWLPVQAVAIVVVLAWNFAWANLVVFRAGR